MILWWLNIGRRRIVIRGSNVSNPLTAAEGRKWIFAARLGPKTTNDSMISFLSGNIIGTKSAANLT